MHRKTLCALFAFSSATMMDEPASNPSPIRNAICILYPQQNSTARGLISFSQENILANTKIVASVKGLSPNARHGIHIHEFGDLTEGCTTAGAHYNPHNQPHGAPYSELRHVGDLGNLVSDPFGNSYLCFSDKKISLYGQHSVVGRSVVVHKDEDDLGQTDHVNSKTTGNSGARIACGVIGLSKQFKTVPPNQ